MKIIKFTDLDNEKLLEENFKYHRFLDSMVKNKALDTERLVKVVKFLIKFIEINTTEIKKFFDNGNFTYKTYKIGNEDCLQIYYNGKEYTPLDAFNNLFNVEFTSTIIAE